MYLKNRSYAEAKMESSAENLTLISLSVQLCLNAQPCTMQTKNERSLW